VLGRVTVGLLAAAVLASSGCGSTSGGDASQQQRIQQVKDGVQRLARYVAGHRAFEERLKPASPGNRGRHGKHPHSLISGGKIFGPGLGFVSSSVMEPETSGWTVSSDGGNTIVVAGGDARRPSAGLFNIIRTYYSGQQKSDGISVSGTGAVTITKAPLGRKIVDSAQKHGELEFKSKSGITGTLHLKDDTVTLNR
jgi:hypothetical protein